ncbi:MAG: IS5 family transposase [Candidatus Electronema sp. V4]|uniref:IS5 family transposase n=1 Tax=Candidatus Electronema sp. V4 TaxID=3454756 RepID=UPI0040559603
MRIKPVILQSACKKDSRGRKPRDPREVLNGILWVLRTGAPWKDLPDRHPSHQTCRRRFQQWAKTGVFRRILEELAVDLQERGGIDIREAFIDGSFVPAKKGAGAVGRTKRGKGSRIMAVADAVGLPVAVCLASASPHEVKLVEAALDSLFISGLPEKLIGDKAYDSDGLDENLLKKYGIEMISPHRRNRKKPKTQDGRKLRRCKRRWKVERLFAWLQNFRRLVVRHERHLGNFLAFLQIACSVILLRFILR